MAFRNIKLTIELVPSSSWHNNLRGILKPSMWKDIRSIVTKVHGDKCLICKRSGKMNAHEIWDYDDENHIQKLKDIIPLCYLCHGIKHIGFSSLKGAAEVEKFVKHFMKINDCDRGIYQKHLLEETEKFNERSRHEWQLDLEKLKDF